ncbi:ribosome biogenesis GTPase Der, partial [Chlamydiota bacterium]
SLLSALFNRIAGKRIAIVDKVSGITRDLIETEVQWDGKSFILVDTGGYIADEKDSIISKVKKQVKKALKDASLLLFVVDIRQGITPLDLEVASLLRKAGKPIIVVGNKADNNELQKEVVSLYEFGFKSVLSVSALHGLGITDLLDAITEFAPIPSTIQAESVTKLAIIGRPNVGKSTFINEMINDERLIVDDLPGTTRDSIDVLVLIEEEKWILIDTAGIRKAKKMREAVEKYSLLRTKVSIKRADIVLVMLDACGGMAKQDEQAIALATSLGKSCVIAVNKWDLINDLSPKEYKKILNENYDVLGYYPLICVSLLGGYNVKALVKLLSQVNVSRKKFVKTTELNLLIQDLIQAHNPPIRKRKRLKIYYSTQIHASPPRFLLFVNNPIHVDHSYKKYLCNGIREQFDFKATPIEIIFHGKKL